jgi:ribosome-associated translation inhibitor RaiA
MYVQFAGRVARQKEIDIENYARSKIETEVRKLVAKPVGLRIRVDENRGMEKVMCQVRAGDGCSVTASHEAPTVQEAIDAVVAKLTRQLVKRKQILKNHKRPFFQTSWKNDEGDEPVDPEADFYSTPRYYVN